MFLLGRCPPIPWLTSGQSSVMFYNITRRIFKILLNLFILVVGFAFGFFILQKDTSHDHFENPIKSIVKVCSFILILMCIISLFMKIILRYKMNNFDYFFQTLIMVLGEYEINDMLEGEIKNDSKFTLYFTMILLALLAIVGR